jgi:putative transposase
MKTSYVPVSVPRRAQDWPWSSLSCPATSAGRALLSRGPLDRPGNWYDLVNEKPDESELADLRTSVTRGRPFGGPAWTRRTAERFGLAFTLRARGRPWGPRGGPRRPPPRPGLAFTLRGRGRPRVGTIGKR